MNERTRLAAIAAVLALLTGCAQKSSDVAQSASQAGAAELLAVAHVQFEQNATDGDVEVVFEAKAGAQGLAKLTVTAPDGRTVVNFTAPDTSTMGMRQFRFESPEPKDVESLKAAYPEGAYRFEGATASGARFQGSATLSHALPATTSFLRPGAGEENVSLRHLVLAWTPVSNVDAYIVYIEQDELKVSISARLPGSASMFAVPDGFLAPATAYTMGLGTVTKDGNASYVEATFTTAAK